MPPSSPNSGARSIAPPNAWEPSRQRSRPPDSARKMVEEGDRRSPDRLAANNHSRFVRAQRQDDLVFAGYDQDAWVRCSAMGSTVERSGRLWQAYNRHIACVMESADIPALVVTAGLAQPRRACVEACAALGTDNPELLHARLRRASRTPPAPGARTRLGSVKALRRAQGIDGPAVSRPSA